MKFESGLLNHKWRKYKGTELHQKKKKEVEDQNHTITIFGWTKVQAFKSAWNYFRSIM